MLLEELTKPALTRFDNNEEILEKAEEIDKDTFLTIIGGPLILRYEFGNIARKIGLPDKKIRIATILALLTFFIEIVVFIVLPRLGLHFDIFDALLAGRFFSFILLIIYDKFTKKHMRLAKFYNRTEKLNIIAQVFMGVLGIIAEILLLLVVGLGVGVSVGVAIIFGALLLSGKVLGLYIFYRLIKYLYKKIKGRKTSNHE